MVTVFAGKMSRFKVVRPRVKRFITQDERAAGMQEPIEELGLMIFAASEPTNGDPKLNRVLGLVDLPADAWLSGCPKRFGCAACFPRAEGRSPSLGLVVDMIDAYGGYLHVSVQNLLRVASDPVHSGLGMNLVADYRPYGAPAQEFT